MNSSCTTVRGDGHAEHLDGFWRTDEALVETICEGETTTEDFNTSILQLISESI